jgi:hypothetical protein
MPGQSDAEIQAALVEEAKEACSLSPVIFNYTKAFDRSAAASLPAQRCNRDLVDLS